MFKKYISYSLVFVLIIILVQFMYKCSYGDKGSSYDYSYTKKKILNGVIKRVIVSRYTRIEIDNEKSIYMIAADYAYPVNNPKTDTLFSVGDSIMKNANNDTFRIVRKGKTFYYVLPN